jgi:hypothetical protein
MSTQSGFALIPLPAKVLSALIASAILSFLYWQFRIDGAWFFIIPGLFLSALLAGTILLAGYVYADAKQRGMPPVPWTALALLVPNGVGFVLYFLLRRPIVRPCPGCGYGLPAGAAFCSRCGRRQMANQSEGSAA